jgi:hypothetical protein
MAAMLFSADEVASGTIDHAIRFILPNSRMRAGVYVRPASHAGGPSGGANLPPYGVRFRLRANYPVASLPTEGARVIARALQRYGMILSDGGNIALTAQSDRFTTHKWSQVGVDSRSLQAILPSDMEVVGLGTPSALRLRAEPLIRAEPGHTARAHRLVQHDGARQAALRATLEREVSTFSWTDPPDATYSAHTRPRREPLVRRGEIVRRGRSGWRCGRAIGSAAVGDAPRRGPAWRRDLSDRTAPLAPVAATLQQRGHELAADASADDAGSRHGRSTRSARHVGQAHAAEVLEDLPGRLHAVTEHHEQRGVPAMQARRMKSDVGTRSTTMYSAVADAVWSSPKRMREKQRRCQARTSPGVAPGSRPSRTCRGAAPATGIGAARRAARRRRARMPRGIRRTRPASRASGRRGGAGRGSAPTASGRSSSSSNGR